MPLTDQEYDQYQDEPGSWGRLSEGWPETPYSAGKFLLCTKADVVPYGSYVVVGAKPITGPGGSYGGYDYNGAVIRCETEELRDKLESVHDEMFVKCRRFFLDPNENGEFANIADMVA